MLPEGAGCYRKLLVATERGWLLHEAFGCYRKVMVATGSFWLLHEGDGCFEKLVATRSWLLLYTGSCRMLKKL